MKKVAVFLADGFETIEALTVVDVMRRANIQCDTFALEGINVASSHNITVTADKMLSDFNGSDYDLILLPGGMPGSINLKNNDRIIEIVKDFNNNNKFIAAVCAAPIVLKRAEVITNRNITSYPSYKDELADVANYKEEAVVVDNNIITSRGPATTLAFSYEILNLLGYKKQMEEIREGMLYTVK